MRIANTCYFTFTQILSFNTDPMALLHNYNDKDKVLVAVDCIIFGFDPNEEELKILLIKRDFEPEKGKWSLMGGFLYADETLNSAANRVLHRLTGLSNVYLEQMQAFSLVDRDPVERTISVAFYALVNIQDVRPMLGEEHEATWFEISKKPMLIFDHDEMVNLAISRLRYKASVEPIGSELLPDKFTMRHIQKLYEEIFHEKFDKRNFSKKVTSLGLLKRLTEKDKGSSKKGSYLYQFDTEVYNRKGAMDFKSGKHSVDRNV